MNKREVVWLIVRLIGLYFAYTAIVALFGVAGAVWMIFSVPGAKTGEIHDVGTNLAPTTYDSREQPGAIPGIQPAPPRGAADGAQKNAANKSDPAADAAKREIFKLILWYVFLLLLEGGVGYYLLFHGGLLFNILVRENKPGERKEKEPESILLNLTE